MQDTAASSVDGGLLVGADVHKRFEALTVLEGVNFKLAANEAVGIVGPNGAGKTTLLNVLAGAYPPSGGTVHFNGTDVTAFDAAQTLPARRRSLASDSTPVWRHDRVRELPCRRDDRRRAFGPGGLPSLRRLA